MLGEYSYKQDLAFMGYNTLEGYQRSYGLQVDGIYGNESDTSLRGNIRKIQEKIGAVPDGIAGEETVEKYKIYTGADSVYEGTRKLQAANGLEPDASIGPDTIKLFESGSVTPTSWDFEHFQRAEFACKCGCGYDDIDLRLVQILEEIREHFGGNPVYITSGCRCEIHNAEVGGVQGSWHTKGLAADFYIEGVTVRKLLNYCNKLVNNGVIRYAYTNKSSMNGVVHIDIGDM